MSKLEKPRRLTISDASKHLSISKQSVCDGGGTMRRMGLYVGLVGADGVYRWGASSWVARRRSSTATHATLQDINKLFAFVFWS